MILLRGTPSSYASSQPTLLTPYSSGTGTPEEEEELALLQHLERQQQRQAQDQGGAYQHLPQVQQPQAQPQPRGLGAGWQGSPHDEHSYLPEEEHAWQPGVDERGLGNQGMAENSHTPNPMPGLGEPQAAKDPQPWYGRQGAASRVGQPILLAQPVKPALSPSTPGQPPAQVPPPSGAAPVAMPQSLVFRENYDATTPWEEKKQIRDFILSLKPQNGVPALPRPVRHLQFFFDVAGRAKLPREEQDRIFIPPQEFETTKAYEQGRQKLIDHFRFSRGENILPGQTIAEWARAQNKLTPGGEIPLEIPDTFFSAPTGKLSIKDLFLGADPSLYYSIGAFNMRGQGRKLKALMDKNGKIWVDGMVDVSIKDRYDWHPGKSVNIMKPMIARYIPELYSVKFPQNNTFTIHDSFFQEFLDKGLAKEFDMQSDGFAPLQLRFMDEPKPQPPAPRR